MFWLMNAIVNGISLTKLGHFAQSSPLWLLYCVTDIFWNCTVLWMKTNVENLPWVHTDSLSSCILCILSENLWISATCNNILQPGHKWDHLYFLFPNNFIVSSCLVWMCLVKVKVLSNKIRYKCIQWTNCRTVTFFCPVEVTLVDTIDCRKNVSLFRADCFTAELKKKQQEIIFYV